MLKKFVLGAVVLLCPVLVQAFGGGDNTHPTDPSFDSITATDIYGTNGYFDYVTVTEHLKVIETSTSTEIDGNLTVAEDLSGQWLNMSSSGSISSLLFENPTQGFTSREVMRVRRSYYNDFVWISSFSANSEWLYMNYGTSPLWHIAGNQASVNNYMTIKTMTDGKQILAADGTSLTTPGFAFSNDLDTGFRLSAADITNTVNNSIVTSTMSTSGYTVLGYVKPGSKTIAELKVYTPGGPGEYWAISDRVGSVFLSTGATQFGGVEIVGVTPTF